MSRYFKGWVVAFIFLGLFSCQKEENNPPMEEEEIYEQYGTPFDQVPQAEDIVMYEVNLRAFSPTGDIQGVIEKLDHIESLGVNVIWLMPIYPIGTINSVNSPYSIKDFKAVGAEFGTLADLRALTDQAHARGMAVMLDWVANHTAWDNAWINNPTWYTQDGNGNIVHPPGTNWLDVADLNYNNLDMRAAMIDAMKYWVYEANIDGYRCDHADGVPFNFWKSAIQSLRNIPDRDLILFAEGTRDDHFTAGFDLNFGWQSYSAIKNVFNGSSPNLIFNAHTNEYSNTPPGKHWIRFTTNHDESAWDATPITIFKGVKGALAASVLSIFTGGAPLIYGSQEVGRSGTVPFFTNSTINWNSNPDMLDSYRKMLQFYANSEVARTGLNTIYSHADIVCFKKSLDDKEILILVNPRSSAINYAIPSEWDNTDWVDVMIQEIVTMNGQLTLQPYQFLILELT